MAPDCTTSDHHELVEWPLKPFFCLVKAGLFCHRFEVTDMKTIGGVKVQWNHEDDPDILEKPRGATFFVHSSTADE